MLPLNCDAFWSVGLTIVTLIVVGIFSVALLKNHGSGDQVTRDIIARLRATNQQVSQRYDGLKPAELLQRLKLDALNTELVNRQDYLLLERSLRQQFRLSVGVYVGSTILVCLTIMAMFQLTPRPPQLGGWALRSIDKEAEDHAVDTDDLLLSWKAAGCPQEIEVYLVNLQSKARTPSIHVMSTDEHVTISRMDYRGLLINRDPDGVNQVVAEASSFGGYTASPAFNLYVGITILINTDAPDHVWLSALIDNSTQNLPRFVFKGILLTWNQAPGPGGGGGVGTMLAEGFFRNPQARVNLDTQLSQQQWQRLAFAYTGDAPWRFRQDKKLPLALTGEKFFK